MLNSVVEDPFNPQPQGKNLDGIAGGTMGADHPLTWCKDYQGGRSFYTALGNTAAAFDADLTTLLKGGIGWAAGAADPVYSDCGATVLPTTSRRRSPRSRTSTSRSGSTNSRTAASSRPRAGRGAPARPRDGHDPGHRRLRRRDRAADERIYTHSEDGLYGPAIDNDFATNKWVYLFYSPQTVTDVKLSTGQVVTQTTPNTTPPDAAPSKTAWDPWVGYFQLSRFKFVEDAQRRAPGPGSEQQIMKRPAEPAGVLPRRRRHRLRHRQQHVAGHG